MAANASVTTGGMGREVAPAYYSRASIRSAHAIALGLARTARKAGRLDLAHDCLAHAAATRYILVDGFVY